MPLFWINLFNKEGPNMKKARRYVMTWLASSLMAPMVSVFIGCMPLVMDAIARRTRALEHPPEADPEIIRAIYFGRHPLGSSFATDRTDNRNPASDAVQPSWRPSMTL